MMMLSLGLGRLLKVCAILSIPAVFLTLATPASADPIVGYKFDVTTFYQFGAPASLTYADFGIGSPDTGYWTITNNGASTFSGSIGQVAVSGFGPDFSYSHSLTLAPGNAVTFAVNDESSNTGGYNGPFGTVQPGVTIQMMGTVTGIRGTESVSLSVTDASIHSGVPRTNPFGVTLDNYVLQGGDPFGRDTGDGYEVTQAPGTFEFFQVVPEPSSLALLGIGLASFGGAYYRRLRKA